MEENKMMEITKGDAKLGDQLPLHTQLRNWFKSQTKWKTKKEFADDIGIKYKTLEDYFYKGSRPGKEIKKKEKPKTLQDSSKVEREPKEVEIFTDMTDEIIEIQKISSNLNEKLNDLTEIYEKCIANKLPHSKEDSTIEERVVIVKELVYALNRELEFFKKGSSESREIFGNSIYAPDVGYIMALFKALFDEDKFQTWLLMSSYELKRRRT
jgi:hypothetical protein